MTKSKTIALAVLFVLVSFANSASAHLHPGLGRFVQRDPLEYVDASSLYLYVRSDPPNLMDPRGRASCRDCPNGMVWRPKPNGVVPAVDGCSMPDWVEDLPQIHDRNNPEGRCDFKPACDNHDLCYSDCSKTRKQCDDKFWDDLDNACTNCAIDLETAGHSPAYVALFILECHFWRDKYNTAVGVGGYEPYCDRQRLNCGCFRCTQP